MSGGVEKQDVFIMRHGARQDAYDKRWVETASRPYDTPLSIQGHHRTAGIVRERLADKGIEVVVSSPFLRCLQTATHAYTALDLPGLHTCNQLCEILVPDNHMNETPSVPALEEARPETVFLSIDSATLPAFPETREVCYARYRKALDTLADQYWPQNLLLVTHQGCVQEALGWGGKLDDYEATYWAHVQLRRTTKGHYNWRWEGDRGVYAYEKLIS